MDIFEEVVSLLNTFNYPVNLANREEEKPPCFVYNIVEYQGDSSDSKEYRTEYSILINLYIEKNKIIEYRKKVKDLLVGNGFVKNQIPNSFWDSDAGTYNQPFLFTKYKIEN